MQDGAGLRLLGRDHSPPPPRRAAGTDWAALAADLEAAVARLGAVTATLWGAGDPAVTLANATAYLEAAGHVVVAWLWLEQALATRDSAGDFYDGKRAAARYFHRHELPKVHLHLDLLESLDRTVLDTDERWL